jgi:Uma2 family endonuclease
MATLPIASRLVSVEEYLSHCYEPDCEYDDGLIVERNLGEYDHSFLQILIGTIFTVNMEAWGVYGLTGQRICIAPRKYRIPDLCVLRFDALAEDILTQPPLIAIEILSSADRISRVERKAIEFRIFGVPEVWIIDSRKRAVYRTAADGLKLVEDGELSVPGTPILLRTGELFAKLDRMRARSRRV